MYKYMNRNYWFKTQFSRLIPPQLLRSGFTEAFMFVYAIKWCLFRAYTHTSSSKKKNITRFFIVLKCLTSLWKNKDQSHGAAIMLDCWRKGICVHPRSARVASRWIGSVWWDSDGTEEPMNPVVSSRLLLLFTCTSQKTTILQMHVLRPLYLLNNVKTSFFLCITPPALHLTHHLLLFF